MWPKIEKIYIFGVLLPWMYMKRFRTPRGGNRPRFEINKLKRQISSRQFAWKSTFFIFLFFHREKCKKLNWKNSKKNTQISEFSNSRFISPRGERIPPRYVINPPYERNPPRHDTNHLSSLLSNNLRAKLRPYIFGT